MHTHTHIHTHTGRHTHTHIHTHTHMYIGAKTQKNQMLFQFFKNHATIRSKRTKVV